MKPLNWTPPEGFRLPADVNAFSNYIGLTSGLIEQCNFGNDVENYFYPGDYDPSPISYTVALFRVKLKPCTQPTP